MKRVELKMKDGKVISVGVWEPEGEIKGIVQIAHGMVEHIGRYELVAQFLQGQGYVVLGDDHRAHGLTDRQTLGYSDGDIFALTISDMAEVAKYAKKTYAGKKLVLFGHSYGSFLTQEFIEVYGDLIDGAVIGGSAQMTGIIPFGGRMVANIGYVFRGAKKPAVLIKKLTFDAYEKKIGGSFISTIPEEAERYKSDELCGYYCSYAFYKYFFKAFTRIYKRENLEKINKDMPVLIMSGDQDPVGDFGKSTRKLYETYKALGIKDLTLKLYEGVRHEYLNDTSRETAYADMLNFVGKICG